MKFVSNNRIDESRWLRRNEVWYWVFDFVIFALFKHFKRFNVIKKKSIYYNSIHATFCQQNRWSFVVRLNKYTKSEQSNLLT